MANELLDDPAVAWPGWRSRRPTIAITSEVVTAYINRYAEAYGEQYKTDADLGPEPFQDPDGAGARSISRATAATS